MTSIFKAFIIFPAVFFFLCGFKAVGQDSGLLQIIRGITDTSKEFPVEKVFIQTDKPSYHCGDTMWFKGYVFNATSLTGTSKSGILYVEVANVANQVVRTIMVPVYDGLAWGYFNLDEKDFPGGAYTLRAYTNWMRNFDEHRIFKKQFYINKISRVNWMVHSRFNAFTEGKDRMIHSHLIFDQMNGEPASDRQVLVKLRDGTSRIWYKDKFQTDVNGALDFNFRIPGKAQPDKLSLSIQDLRQNETVPDMHVPIIINRPEEMDLQFMPEGGTWVAGIKSTVAFKAIGENGKGCDISGVIYNKERQEVARFKSSHLGMGSFDLTPLRGETYTAEIVIEGHQPQSYPLPPVKNAGIVLRVSNPLSDQDSVQVNIFSSAGMQSDRVPYYLVAESRGIGCYGAMLALNKPVRTLYISKNYFPTGVVHLTLLNAALRPLCQRLIFIDHHDCLEGRISSKKQYTTLDSVALAIDITDNTGRPIQSDLSMAVTDDGQVHLDSLQRNSLVSDILLSSDIRGHVENPGYYFCGETTEKKWSDLDNLLLTQGWVSYSPGELDDSGHVLYPSQMSYTVSGKITNIFNKPVIKSHVLLLSRKPSFFQDTLTDKSGGFTFHNLYPLDNTAYFIQASNKHGKSFNVGIELNTFKRPVLQPLDVRVVPWYVNTDTNRLGEIHTRLTNEEEINKLRGEHILREVVVVGQKVVQGSKNLNGPGGADQVIDQAALEKAGDSTLRQLLEKHVKGFNLGGKTLDKYVIFDETLHLVIDGVHIDFFRPPGENRKLFYDGYLDYLTAKDIKGIEVMKTPRYTGAYVQKFLNPLTAKPMANAFIEITTFSGNGAFLKKTPGVYLFRPAITFNTPEHFYSPKYPVKTDKRLIDLRSTIYWNPNILTDKNGKATVSFYTAGKPGTYTILLEGSDMNGHILSVSRKITVK